MSSIDFDRSSNSAFNAFQSQLKTLCLNEFPCGIGTWTAPHGKKTKFKRLEAVKVPNRFVVTHKDYGHNHEKTETLEELVTTKTSPWNLDYSWSNEAKELREVAVRSPWLVNDKFIKSYFKTLKIVDKGVDQIDESFLQLENLEELTLSANKLQTVLSENLPPYLKVLEVCANRISTLADLCSCPPPLNHLGLGYNQIYMVDDFITGDYWPNLLSLDLSHNNLTDIMDIVRKLQTLPKLRNLILQGNPLSLIPGYRGYTIDSLRKLSFLDDIGITADEKHHFKGLAKKREYIMDECKVTLSVDFMAGIQMPDEIKFPDDQPEYPIVTKKYFVQFMYLEHKSANAEIFRILQDDQYTVFTGTDTQNITAHTGQEILAGLESRTVKETLSPDHHQDALTTIPPESVLAATDYNDDLPPHTATEVNTTSEEQAKNAELFTPQDGANIVIVQDEDEHQSVEQEPPIKLSAVNLTGVNWAEDMDCTWNKVVVRDDLLTLRNFFKDGMEINVIQEKVESFPADQLQEGNQSPTDQKGDKGKKGKDAKKNKKPEKVDDKKKKKKGEDQEMVNMPAEFKTLVSFHVPLEEFLEGDFEILKTFTHEWEQEKASSPSLTDMLGKKEDQEEAQLKEKEEAKPKAKEQAKTKDKKDKKESHKSPKADRKDKKGKGGAASTAEGMEEEGPPPPLELRVSIKMEHWKTAMDCLKSTETDQVGWLDQQQQPTMEGEQTNRNANNAN